MDRTPLIRVSRKRTADPHEALIVQIKKHKQADPVVFTFFKTEDRRAEDNNEGLNGVHVLDYSKTEAEEPIPIDDHGEGSSSGPSGSASAPIHQVLNFMNDDAIGEIGDHKENRREVAQEQVMLNGQVMVPVAAAAPQNQAIGDEAASDDVVFDYYRLNAANDQNAAMYSNQFLRINAISEESFDVRFANREDIELLGENSSDADSDIAADDDDDSNEEDNWRNDYPDEDSYDDNSDEGEGAYGHLVPQQFHRGEPGFPDENMQRRFQNFSINDRYESYFEGDETSDDDDM